MYEVQTRQWMFRGDEEEALRCCEAAPETKDAEVLFLAADYLLSRARRQERNIDGVYYMEKAAKSGCVKAMFAMGQMAEYGWAVGKSSANALKWYQEAARAGSRDADRYWKRLKNRRRLKRMGMALGLLAAAAAVAAAFWTLSRQTGPKEPGESQEAVSWEETERGQVLVGEDTQLEETDTLEEFNENVRELVAEYDDELVISGERSTNRLILRFAGKELDLTGFLADRVIARENNMVVIQFDSEEEAIQCMEALKQMDEISFVEMDEYNISVNTEKNSGRQASLTAAGTPYYTWGCQDMGMDQLADYLADHAAQTSAVVAVLDSGTEPVDGIADRVLSGIDVVTGGDGRSDLVGHGTHVSGTILDCTRGLDVKVLPVGIFGENIYTNTMSICMGLEYAISQSPEVINMSLGGPAGPEGVWQEELIRQAVQAGITVVVSAGNGDMWGNPEDTAGYMPASMEECIVVGAVDRDHNIASFSNYGDSVDVCAPGVDITSYSIKPEGLESMDGTSMAAPHISALAAMLSMYVPEAAPEQLEKYIKDYCQSLGDEQYYGEGLPQGTFYIED